jgi:hypothetical protein
MPFPALAIIAIMIAGLGLAACNGSAPLSPAGMLPTAGASGAAPAVKPGATPYVFTFVTVDKPGTDFNRVTGINDPQQITGYHGSGSASDPAIGYKIGPPYQSPWLHIAYPGAVNTYAMALSDDYLCVGYFVPNEVGDHTQGFVNDHGLYTAYKDPKTPPGTGTINELLGVNDYETAVGFYSDASGLDHAYELYITQGKFVGLKPPGFTSTVASGISDLGAVDGFGTHTDGTTHGWMYVRNAYMDVSYPAATSTEALAINYQNQAVGQYQTGDGTTHGFIVSDIDTGGPVWQSIDEPNAAGTTVVDSVNDHHVIAGYYVDSAGTTHGFVATPCVASCDSSRRAIHSN